MAVGTHPEASLRRRTGEAYEQKHAIARWAAAVIQPGENILLDAGSTAGALADELRGFGLLSVTTPGINTLQELAEPALERMSFDRLFLGADAVTAEGGISGKKDPIPAPA